VYPNPSTGPVQIKGLSGSSSVTITNIAGQTVYTGVIETSNTSSIDLSNQANGIYTIRIQNATGSVTRSILISNK
ncbi:MAG: T9SS type A sorting domain-containing protein, partial [Bacteroidota bacterium]